MKSIVAEIPTGVVTKFKKKVWRVSVKMKYYDKAFDKPISNLKSI